MIARLSSEQRIAAVTYDQIVNMGVRVEINPESAAIVLEYLGSLVEEAYHEAMDKDSGPIERRWHMALVALRFYFRAIQDESSD